ncbi:MAG: hypothetical protein HYY93_06540 [Planctomycetes bacterium]|nr:hypothetical protein [Planctomycetota bacterium]
MSAMIEFMCPHCRSRLGLDERFAGKRARCPRCSETISVPPLPPSASVPVAELAGEPPAPGVPQIGAEIGSTIGDFATRAGELVREERETVRSGLQSATGQAKEAVREEWRDAKAAAAQALRRREELLKQQVSAAKDRAKERIREKAKAASPSIVRTCAGCLVTLCVIGAFIGLIVVKASRPPRMVQDEEMRRQLEQADNESPGGPPVRLSERTGPLTNEDDRLVAELFRRLSHRDGGVRNDALDRIRALIRRDTLGMLDRLKAECEANEEDRFVEAAADLLFTQFGELGHEHAVHLASAHADRISYVARLVSGAKQQPEPDQVRRALERLEQATRGGKAHGTVLMELEKVK